MEKLLRRVVEQLRDDGKAFEALNDCRLPTIGGFSVLPKVIDDQRKELIMELEKFIRHCNYK